MWLDLAHPLRQTRRIMVDDFDHGPEIPDEEIGGESTPDISGAEPGELEPSAAPTGRGRSGGGRARTSSAGGGKSAGARKAAEAPKAKRVKAAKAKRGARKAAKKSARKPARKGARKAARKSARGAKKSSRRR